MKVELAEYVDDFIVQRFPEGFPEDMAKILKEIVFDAFHDGANWAEFQHVGENKSKIIKARA